MKSTIAISALCTATIILASYLLIGLDNPLYKSELYEDDDSYGSTRDIDGPTRPPMMDHVTFGLGNEEHVENLASECTLLSVQNFFIIYITVYKLCSLSKQIGHCGCWAKPTAR